MKKARQLKVTIRTVEIRDEEDYVMKIRKKKQLLDKFKNLMDSTIETYAIWHQNWLVQAKETARKNSMKGVEAEESHTYWVEDTEAPKDDYEMNLIELREKYPDVKSTSIDGFLAQVNELK